MSDLSGLVMVVSSDNKGRATFGRKRWFLKIDDLAVLRNEGDPISPVLLFHDGKELTRNHNQKNVRLLLEGSYDKVVYCEPQREEKFGFRLRRTRAGACCFVRRV